MLRLRHRVQPQSQAHRLQVTGFAEMAAAAVEQSVAPGQNNVSCRVEQRNQHLGQHKSQLWHIPSSIQQKVRIDVVSSLPQWIDKRKDVGDCPLHHAQRPTDYELSKNVGSQDCKNWKELLKKLALHQRSCDRAEPSVVSKISRDHSNQSP